MNELDLYNKLLKKAKYKIWNEEDAKDLVQSVYLLFYSYDKRAEYDCIKLIQYIFNTRLKYYYRMKHDRSDTVLTFNKLQIPVGQEWVTRDEYIDNINPLRSYNDGEFRVDKKYFKEVIKSNDVELVKAHHGMLDKPYNRLTCRSEFRRIKGSKGQLYEYYTFDKSSSRRVSAKSQEV